MTQVRAVAMVLLGSLCLGALVALYPMAAAAVMALAFVIALGIRPHGLLLLILASRILLTGLGKVYAIHVGGLDLNASMVLDSIVLALGCIVLLSERRPLLYRETLPVLGLGILGAITLFWAPDAVLGAKGVLKLFTLVLIYAVARRVGETTAGQDYGVRAILLLAAIAVFLGVLEFATGINIVTGKNISSLVISASRAEMGEFSRVYSTFTHPNMYAFAMSLVAVLALGEWILRRSKWLLLLALACLFVVVVTFTRVAWAASAVAVLGLIGFDVVTQRRMTGAVAVVAGIGIAAAGVGNTVVQRVAVDSSAVLRVTLMRTELAIAARHPFTGIGYEGVLASSVQLFGFKVAAHGDYVRLLTETGFLGLVLFCIWMWRPIVDGFRTARESTDPTRRTRALTLMMCFVVASIFAMTDNATEGLGLLMCIAGLSDGDSNLSVFRSPSPDPY